MFFLFFKFLIGLAVFIILIGFLWTWKIQHSENQKIFLSGKVPGLMPDGVYQGDIGRATSWVGKKFDAQKNSGINTLEKDGVKIERYPFKTYLGKGLHNKSTDVIKIDYNLPENPVWVRIIIDEIVEIAPNEYSGKMFVKVIPGFPFALLYFRLKK